MDEWLINLQRLPRPLTAEDCAWLDDQFGMDANANGEIACQWLIIAAASAYEPAFDHIRTFLGSVGRMKFLKPIYGALMGNPGTVALAREIFAASADDYHPIARGGLQALFDG